MARRYAYKIEDLRELGWQIWDPIGLIDSRMLCDDEYDSYLLGVVGQLSNNKLETEIVKYLVQIETEHMGLNFSQSAEPRAKKLVAAIVQYLQSLPVN
jgi:hypothetical protein